MIGKEWIILRRFDLFKEMKRLLFILLNIEDTGKSIDNDLKKNKSKLDSNTEDLDRQVFDIERISRELGVDTTTEEFQNRIFDRSPKIFMFQSEEEMFNHDKYEELLTLCARELVIKHPSIKEKHIFHGGCLSCKTPIIDGIGACNSCKYFHWLSGKPDLSEKYKSHNTTHA